MTHSEIRASQLTTFDVAQDGSHACLHMQDTTGNPATVVLPLESLNQLLMSIPKMVQMALQRSHGDESLRLVHALEGFKLEFGEMHTQPGQFILTLHTSGGFAASFSADVDNMSLLAHSILEETPEYSSPVGTARLS